MQTRNKVFDDLSQLMTNAMGVAQGARSEAETAMKGMIDRWLADRDFVTREEFDAVRAMAQKAREENEALKARIDAMEKGGARSTRLAGRGCRKRCACRQLASPHAMNGRAGSDATRPFVRPAEVALSAAPTSCARLTRCSAPHCFHVASGGPRGQSDLRSASYPKVSAPTSSG